MPNGMLEVPSRSPPPPGIASIGELRRWPAVLYSWFGVSFCCLRNLFSGTHHEGFAGAFLVGSAIALGSGTFTLGFRCAFFSGGGVGTCDLVSLATGFTGPPLSGRGMLTSLTRTDPGRPPSEEPKVILLPLPTKTIPPKSTARPAWKRDRKSVV